MESTKKELIIIKSAFIGLFIIVLGFAFMFAKLEYRPMLMNVVTKSLNTSYLVNSNRDILISYSVQITSTLSLAGGQSGTVSLQRSPDNVNWTTVGSITNNNNGTLTIGLNTSQVQTAPLITILPAGYYVKIVTSGASTFAYISGTETLL